MPSTLTVSPPDPKPLSAKPPLHMMDDVRSGRRAADESRDYAMPYDLRRASELSDSLLALQEPWASRFVEYIASRAQPLSAKTVRPSRSELVVWLTNQRLQQFVQSLLRNWHHANPG